MGVIGRERVHLQVACLQYDRFKGIFRRVDVGLAGRMRR